MKYNFIRHQILLEDVMDEMTTLVDGLMNSMIEISEALGKQAAITPEYYTTTKTMVVKDVIDSLNTLTNSKEIQNINLKLSRRFDVPLTSLILKLAKEQKPECVAANHSGLLNFYIDNDISIENPHAVGEAGGNGFIQDKNNIMVFDWNIVIYLPNAKRDCKIDGQLLSIRFKETLIHELKHIYQYITHNAARAWDSDTFTSPELLNYDTAKFYSQPWENRPQEIDAVSAATINAGLTNPEILYKFIETVDTIYHSPINLNNPQEHANNFYSWILHSPFLDNNPSEDEMEMFNLLRDTVFPLIKQFLLRRKENTLTKQLTMPQVKKDQELKYYTLNLDLIIQVNIINWIASNRRTFMRTLYKYLETKEAS